MAKEMKISSPVTLTKGETGTKGGPGTYDGDTCGGLLPKRTLSPNAIPEKIFDKTPPLPKQ